MPYQQLEYPSAAPQKSIWANSDRHKRTMLTKGGYRRITKEPRTQDGPRDLADAF